MYVIKVGACLGISVGTQNKARESRCFWRIYYCVIRTDSIEIPEAVLVSAEFYDL